MFFTFWKSLIKRKLKISILCNLNLHIPFFSAECKGRIGSNNLIPNPSCCFFRLQLYLPLSLPVPHPTGLQRRWKVINRAVGFVGWLYWDRHKCGEKNFAVHTTQLFDCIHHTVHDWIWLDNFFYWFKEPFRRFTEEKGKDFADVCKKSCVFNRKNSTPFNMYLKLLQKVYLMFRFYPTLSNETPSIESLAVRNCDY